MIVGVPQGSVLGPLLFNLFINDLLFIIKTDICNYADDNTPYAVDMTLGGLMEKLEGSSNCALQWFCDNGMKPNSSICGHQFEVMLCKIGNSQVIETHLTKLLGIKMESELTFNKHVDLVYKKASQKLNALTRMCAFIPCDKRKMLVNAFFSSLFSSSQLVWMFHNRRINAKIYNLHYRALCMIY